MSPIIRLPDATDEQNQIADMMVGECAKAVFFLLRGRRQSVRVRGLGESGFMQLVALSALVERTLEEYPAKDRDVIREYGRQVAAVIARSK